MKDFREIIPIVIKELAFLTMFVVFLYVTILFGVVLFKITGIELTREHARTLQLYVSIGFLVLYLLCQGNKLFQWIRKNVYPW
ncbi:MAG: hypothetical protein GF409_01935 [Candidatus Omnitrophica bacterium]|nr:hypothetical protein [Candidatus Omnitrophota bacterium]